MRRYFCIILICIVFTDSQSGISLNSWFNDLTGDNTGHTTCNFLNLPVSAVQLSRGLASYTGMTDATDLSLYPANSALSNRNKFAITHLEWIMGLRKEYIGALFPLQDIGIIGFHSSFFSPGAFTNAHDIDENQTNPEMLEFAGGISFASSFFKQKLNTGFSLSFVESRLDDISGGAVSFSGNLLYSPLPSLHFQINGANFGTEMTYTNTKESLPARAGISLKVRPLPHYCPFTSKFNFDISTGISKIADEPLIAGISSEITILDYLKLRTGYDYTYGNKPDLGGLCAGAGFHYGMYGVDLGWKNQSNELGSVWATTLKLQMDEIQPRTAEDYYQAASRYFNHKRFKFSTLLAYKALRLDPSMWKAHSLLTMIRSQQLREKNIEICLFYTGNIKGAFTIPFDPLSFGGLSRIISVMNTLRSQFNVFFAIETGNFTPVKSHLIRIKLAGLALQYSKFSAICAGSQELMLGAEKITNAINSSDLKFICSNADKDIPCEKNTIIESHGYRIYVASYTNKNSLDPANKSKLKLFDEKELITDDASSCHLKILVIDDNWEQIRKIAAKLIDFDIVICNNLDQHFPSPINIGKVKILSTGKSGEYAGYLTMRFNDSKQLISIENRLIPMNTQIKPDPFIDSLVRSVAAQIELSNNGIDSVNISRRSTQGSFVFLSDRDSSVGIYLKNSVQLAEFPLSRSSGMNCDLPAYSFPSSKIAFRQKKSNCASLAIMEISGALQHTIKDSISIRDITFSPNGEWIYFAGSPCNGKYSDILRVRFDGGKPIPVITWEESSEYDINVASDNSTIAFCSDRDETPQIYVCGADGSQPIRITDSSAIHASPKYSPTNTYCAYLSDFGNFQGRMDLWVYDKIKGIHRRITSNSNVKTYCWLSDGITIVYSSGANILDLNKVDIELYRFSKLVTDTGLKTYNDISPQRFYINGVEKVIFVREETDGNKKIMMINIDGTDLKNIVDSKGNDWLP